MVGKLVLPRTALIVDDSRAQRMVLARHLIDWGFEVSEAGSGAQALRACAGQHFDLILSDWMMPEMNGLEFCRAFRAQPRDHYSYFILLTSKSEKESVAEGLDVGADDFLSKPVSTLELRARIKAGERLLAMERQVKTARAQLVAAVEGLDDGFVFFDAENRIVLANSRFRDFYPLCASAITQGARFEDILRQGLSAGQYKAAIGREEDWFAERMQAFRDGTPIQQELIDGRVLQVVERPTEDGGRVGLRVDVTELHRAREQARRAEAKAVQQNVKLSAALGELQQLYDALDRDLMEARKLQQSLIQKPQHEFGSARLSLLLQSSGHVGGDMVGMFQIAPTRIGVYSIDVSGHGVAAAMLGARISGLFSGGHHNQNIVLARDPLSGERIACPPHQVAARINDLMIEELETEAYLTIAYADIDLRSGDVRVVQAGHPHPVIQRACGAIEFIGSGGLPIGLIPQAEFVTIEARLSPGDRLFLYSDGITECTDAQETEFGEEGLSAAFERLSGLKGLEFLDALKWELTTWSGSEEFGDDVSGVIFEFDDYAQDIAAEPALFQGIPALN